jgi:phage pi2 protein 07
MKKDELIQVLVDEYGYGEKDLHDKEGKPYTNAKLKAMIEAEKRDAEEAEVNSHRVQATMGDLLKDDDKIRVMSGSSGAVVYYSETSRRQWRFDAFGQMDTIPYGELVTMRNRYPSFFTEGLIVVLDVAVQEEFRLTEIYENILTPQNIDSVFEMKYDELEILVKNLPEGMKLTFINKAQELYETDKLDSLSVLRLIEKEFGFSLADNTPVDSYAYRNQSGEKIIYLDKN